MKPKRSNRGDGHGLGQIVLGVDSGLLAKTVTAAEWQPCAMCLRLGKAFSICCADVDQA